VVFHLREINPGWTSRISSLAGVQEVECVDQKLVVLAGVQEVECVDQKLVVALENPERINPQIIRILVEEGADLQFVGELRHSLEDIYLQAMNDSEDKVESL